MAESDYRSMYKQFFEEFAKTVSPDDQLPVKVAGYNLCENELTGEIVDWILQYLGQKRCPSSLLAPLTTLALAEIRQAIRENPVACGYIRENNVFHSLRLMQFVITVKVNEVCLRYLSPGSIETFPPPPPELQTTACAIKNNRRRMEDRHTIIEDFHTIFDVKDAGLATYYGVFDGHAGTDAAIYGVSHLHQFLAESPLYPSNPVEALREAFLKTDELFLDKSRREDLRSGTTALCAVLQHTRRMLYVGWVGDSQAVLVTRGRPRQLVMPHKPERSDERQRIEDMGGCVLYWGTWRVNGQLAVSRAIGDLDYKPYVSAEPDIQAIPLDDNQDFLILACDGLWDFVTEQDAVVSVYNTIREHPGDLEAVSQNLVQLSKQKSSLDNISVIVVFLTDPATLAALDVWPTPEPETMDTTSLETNPFQTNGGVQPQTNGSDPAYQKANLLLDLNTGDKYSGKEGGGGVTSPSATDLCFLARPTNGKEDVSYDDDDFGPETDVDAVDDVLLSPAIAAAKAAAAAAAEEEGVAGGCAEKHLLLTGIEADLELQRQQLSVFDPVSEPREETPTPPADDVPGGPLLAPEVDNVAESGEESEDEWNYYRGEQSDEPAAATEAPAKTAQEIEDDESMESRLNPNAAEFIPSPTATKPSMEEVLSASPLKGGVAMDNVTIPSSLEFQQEVSLRPAEIDAGNPFSANDDFFNTVPDFVNGKEDDCANLEKTPYQLLQNESAFGDFPDRLNPFKASEHLFDKSEVSSTKAEFGDETTTSFVSDSEQLLKPFVDDPLNASMVESDFLMDNDINFQSNTSTDMFGLDLTQDITQSNTSTLSPLNENEMFPVASAPEAMLIDGAPAIDYQDQFASNLAAEAQAMSPPVSPMPAEIADTKPTVPEETPFEQASAFADQVSDIVMHFEEHTEQNFSPFPDIVQESSLYNEFKEQAYAFREAAQSDFSDLVAAVGVNADYIEEFRSEFKSFPEQQPPVQESAMSHEAYDFFNGPPSRELVTEAVVEPVGRNEIIGTCFTGFEEFEDNAHVLLPAEEAAAPPALEAVAPALETVAPALETVAPALETVAPALETVAPALETVAPALETVAPALETVAPALEAVAPALEAVAPALEAVAPALEAVSPAVETVTSPQEAPAADSDATVVAATVAAAGITAGVAALAVGAPTPSKEAAKKEAKKTESDKTKSTPAAGTRTPAKTPLKSTPSSPTKPLPTAAPRSSSTPKKPPTTPSAAPSRVASKTAPAAGKVGPSASPVSKVAASATSQVRAKVGASSPTKPAPPTKVAPAKTAIVPPKPRPATAPAAKTVLADKKPALLNGDAKPIAKRSEPPITKKLVPTAATKPLARPASAPVATKATKTSTVTRTTTTTVGSAAPKPAAKPAVNGVAKPKTAAPPLAPRAKPVATSTTLKTGLVDKQVKETANKQISRTVASKTSTITRTATSSVTGPRRPAGTATKTTTTTTTSNKPSGPIRRPAGTAVTKTTTMKVVDPQAADGEQMVIVQEVTTTITKDESPIADNAHIEVIPVND